MEIVNNFNTLLRAFKIDANCINYKQIDNYFYYDIKLNHKTKVKDLQKYGDELSLALKTPCKPSLKVLHHDGIVRLEFASPRSTKLNLFDLFSNRSLPKGQVNCLLGQSVDGKKIWMDLAQNPHLIVAGTTGSGKSTLIHTIIANLFNYNDVDVILVDPKGIEFIAYEKAFPNIEIIYTYQQALSMLSAVYETMEFRYSRMRAGVSLDNFKNLIIIIDEFADLIMQDEGNELYSVLLKLSQKCRAARINIILATQRPSVKIIDGNIKANFPARICCRVASHVDSKVVFDSVGAENLLGNGDAMLRDNFRSMERFQVAYTNPAEIISYFGNNHGF
jgi:S-DNA-T family DNA segregation ATPase FtsK/SpoIIIE